jgi:WD40 repeat protein
MKKQEKNMLAFKRNDLHIIIIIVFLVLISLNGCIEAYARSPITHISFSPDSSKLLSITEKNTLQIWDVESGQEICRKKISDHGDITWFPDGSKVGIVIFSVGIVVYNTSDLENISDITGNFYKIYFRGDSDMITTNFIEFNKSLNLAKFFISLWNTSTFLKSKNLNIAIINGIIDVSKNDGRIVCLPWDSNFVEIIDAENENNTMSLESMRHSTQSIKSYDLHLLRWSADGKRIILLANFDSDKDTSVLYVWNASSGLMISNKTLVTTRIVDISADATQLLYRSSNRNTVEIMNIATGLITHRLSTSNHAVSSTTWSADGRMVVAGDEDGVIRIWDVETAELLHTLIAPRDYRIPT